MSKFCSIVEGVGPASGNNVSKSNRKTRRRFLPNLQIISFKTSIGSKRLKIATSTLRTITKYGGLEDYLKNVKLKRLTPLAKKMRRKLLKTNVSA